MKYVRKLLFLLFILFICGCKTSQISERLAINSNSDNNWEYFELENEIEAKIIDHLPAPALCGNLAFASVTIVQSKDGEIIRILDLCNTSNYNENEIVKILKAKKPEFNVMLPYRMIKNPKTKQYEYFENDVKILKTAYGYLPKK